MEYALTPGGVQQILDYPQVHKGVPVILQVLASWVIGESGRLRIELSDGDHHAPSLAFRDELDADNSVDRGVVLEIQTWSQTWSQKSQRPVVVIHEMTYMGKCSIVGRPCTYQPFPPKVSAANLARQCHQNDFEALFLSQRNSDIVLRACDEEIHAHSLILSQRSRVFERMFAGGMKEQSTGVVEITDVRPHVLRLLCLFSYTGSLKEEVWTSEGMICELLQAASKYEMPSLEHLCQAEAENKITIENAANMLMMASQVNAERLKAYSIRFITDHGDKVKRTAGWARLMQHKQIVFEVAPMLLDAAFSFAKRRRLSH